ncbi:hypothetical protein BT93_L5844 [Corymbia citriodora subsp. variegata]|uniref:Uncharacterized protein n=1 Tax=Corymbia citriodora subsp. variegata TaxID=360336 RepID=A0A8T0CVT1_CORYI|nr:hypothetical protein BT93_L5844 [Corymbia citriodora subsp. variegata]
MPFPGPNETDWIVQVNESLNSEFPPSDGQRYWGKRSIYKVRSCITELNRKAYQPQVVSFGPYHNGKKHLRPMEEHKDRALRHFLKKSGKSLELFLNSLREVAQALEESYEALDSRWKKGSTKGAAFRFLKLMITDGCFMLEILRTARLEGTQVKQETTQENGYIVNDPIFSDHGKLHIMPYIKRDMLMLENQLPMLVLERLVAVESDHKEGHDSINSLIHKFFFSSALSEDIGKCLHVLDVYRKSLLFFEKPEKKKRNEDKSNKVRRTEIIRSATELHEHGIRLRESKTRSLKDISFDSGITVDDIFESVYLNLIVFEHFHVGAGDEVTSYIFLMDKIINDEKDVALLHTKGIIENAIGSDRAIAEMFNSLCKEVTLRPKSSLDAVHTEVSTYCKQTWYKWRATLRHTYFKSPWSIISFIAAILLFALSIIQTAYAMIYH